MAENVDPRLALNWAAADGDVAQAKELIAAGTPVNEPNEDGNLPLPRAAEKGRTEMVRFLLEAGAQVNGVVGDSRSALIKAATEGHKETVAVLLAAGADVNQAAKQSTPLGEAVIERTKAHEEIVGMLLAAGADVNFGKFSTVLMRASRNSSPSVVKALIQKRASVNTVTRLGTALTMAIRENRPENVAVLLEAGADANVRFPTDADGDVAGKTPLEIAKEKKAKKIIALLEAGKQSSVPSSGTQPSAKSSKAVTGKPTDLWKRIENWLTQHKPKLKATLNPGAGPKEFTLLEKTIGMKLPDDFKKAWKVHNGQKGGGDLVPPPTANEESYFLIPIDDIVREWKSWKGLVDGGEFEGKESGPDQGIQNTWWHPGWVPFASNGGGDSICLDLAPAPGGVSCQVITMNHESTKRELLAPSFAAWFTELTVAIEEGALAD
jgi:cell wall assembly regulator SMI1/ankyrin repeat protein